MTSKEQAAVIAERDELKAELARLRALPDGLRVDLGHLVERLLTVANSYGAAALHEHRRGKGDDGTRLEGKDRAMTDAAAWLGEVLKKHAAAPLPSAQLPNPNEIPAFKPLHGKVYFEPQKPPSAQQIPDPASLPCGQSDFVMGELEPYWRRCKNSQPCAAHPRTPQATPEAEGRSATPARLVVCNNLALEHGGPHRQRLTCHDPQAAPAQPEGAPLAPPSSPQARFIARLPLAKEAPGIDPDYDDPALAQPQEKK